MEKLQQTVHPSPMHFFPLTDPWWTHLSGVHELRGVDVEELLGVLQPHVRRLHQLRVGARQRDPLHAAVARPEIGEMETVMRGHFRVIGRGDNEQVFCGTNIQLLSLAPND